MKHHNRDRCYIKTRRTFSQLSVLKHKRTSSAFSSTDLYTWLEHKKIVDVAVIGAVAGYCVNSTIRMGSDLGLAMTIVRDAVLSFPLEGAGISAAEVFNVTLGLLEGEFAQSVNVADLTFNPR